MFFSKTTFTRLVCGKKSQAGRNHTGHIVVRHHGGSRKRNFILIDFKRTFSTRLALCVNLRCDINRTALVGLLKYADGSFSYILVSKGFFFGSFVRTCQFDVLAYKKFKLTYCVLLAKIPLTSIFFNVEVKLGDGGKYAKAAGTYSSIVWGDKEKELHLIKLPTGKLLVVSSFCFVTLGKNGNYWHKKEILTKAGTRRLLGVRPTVRGVAMNPVDHPHGGRTKISTPEVTPWGKIAKRGR